MMDFLKTFPNVTRDEYLWEWSVPQIRLSLNDSTHVEYLSEKQADIDRSRRNGDFLSSASSIANDLGIPILMDKQ